MHAVSQMFIIMGIAKLLKECESPRADLGWGWHERKRSQTTFLLNGTQSHPFDQFNEFGT